MASAGTSYQQLLDAIESYYGSGSDQWLEVARYGLKADNVAEILRQVPGVQTFVNKSGDITGYTFNNTVPLNDGGLSLPAVNSNVQTGTAAAANTTEIRALGNFTADPQTGNVSATGQIPKKTGGVVGTANAVAGVISAVTVGAGVGLTLGRTVNNLLYDNNPNFWYDITNIPDGSEAQEEWAKITAIYDEVDKDGKVTNFLNAIAGVDLGKKSTVYIDENAFAYYSWMLNKAHFFDTGGSPVIDTAEMNTNDYYGNSRLNDSRLAGVRSVSFRSILGLVSTASAHRTIGGFDTSVVVPVNWYSYAFINNSGQGVAGVIWVSLVNPGSGRTEITDSEGNSIQSSNAIVHTTVTHNGERKDVWICDLNTPVYPTADMDGTPTYDSAYKVLASFGTAFGVAPSTMPGVDDDPGATVPNTSGWDTPASTLQSLKNQYPSLWENGYQNDVIDPNGNPKPVTYIPIALPSGYPNGNPSTVNDPTTQTNPQVDPATATDPLFKTITGFITQPKVSPATITDPATDEPSNPDPNPPDVGGGVTPPLVVPVGSASALWAVYNPTQAEINALGAWLWSNNFVDQLLKMFNDPMQAIIGLHKTFIPPITGAAQDIKVGYLNSGVSSLTVPTQYSSVDCGTINCAEYFGNVFDYAPYTRVYLYLPFIGFKELDVAQVMRGKINVKYHGDAYTGSCLAEVSVIRDGESGGVLYTYSGDCAARYPLSHGSYMGIVNGVIGVATSTAMALGGMMNPIMGLGGIVGSAMGARNKVEHSGGFSGNSGAMGIKKPYLVIMRPQTAMASNYEHFTGQPSNSNVVLGSATGYVRVKECHVEDIATATDAEKQMIESALKTGVII